MRLHFLLLMSLVLLGITFKEEASANPAPAPNPYHHVGHGGRRYYGGRVYNSYRSYKPSRRLSGVRYGYGKRSAEPEPKAGPIHRYGMSYGGKRYGGFGYYGYGK